MTALQEAIEHFKISNSQSAYSNTQIVYILEQFLEKENRLINNSNIFINKIDKNLMMSELYYNKNCNKK